MTSKSATGQTSQVSRDGERLIEKRAENRREAERLEYQYQWLVARVGLPHMPRVHHFARKQDEAALQLEFAAGFVPFFDFIHAPRTGGRAEAVLGEVVRFLAESIHLPRKSRENAPALETYLRVKVREKLAASAASSPTLAALTRAPRLVVNGRALDGAETILRKIESRAEIMRALAHEDLVPVHGDPTIDNILVLPATGEFMLLDPNGENHLCDPTLDFAKLSQSLHGGYEFLCRLREVTVDGNELRFEAGISPEYAALERALAKRIRDVTGAERARLVKFHEGVHYARMLPYKVAGNPETAPAFFGAMIVALNEFYAEFCAEL